MNNLTAKRCHWDLFCLVWLILASSGCNALSKTETAVDIENQAAALATEIVKQARSTAMVRQAQAEATAMISSANLTAVANLGDDHSSSTPEAPLTSVPLTALPRSAETVEPLVAASLENETSTSEGDPTGENNVKILSVTYGADGAYIVVNYTAPPKIAQTYWPGVLSVTDEATGTIYNEVPVMPIIGPLVARPREYGQPAYVMFVNLPVPLQPGSLVTVVLGNDRFEHLSVR